MTPIPNIQTILKQELYNHQTIVKLLEADGDDRLRLFNKAAEVKQKYIGNKVHLRGLIELTNKCTKSCYYCGIGASNKNVSRFMVSQGEVEKAIQFAYDNNYGSIVIQSGELQGEEFISNIERILKSAKKIGKGTLGITLSCGEQTIETYQRWKYAGAHRYLLRIEASNKELYYKLHPNNLKHDFGIRLQALKNLQKCGYQTGTGVMIGLPFQTIDDLAEDLLFMRHTNIDMCGMGPYIEHADTELYKYKHLVPSVSKRVDLSLKMIAILRIIMKDINIASTTAMQTLVNGGRANTTPGNYREQYSLYKGKPGLNEEAEDSKESIEALINRADCVVGYGEQGNSNHFNRRTIKQIVT